MISLIYLNEREREREKHSRIFHLLLPSINNRREAHRQILNILGGESSLWNFNFSPKSTAARNAKANIKITFTIWWGSEASEISQIARQKLLLKYLNYWIFERRLSHEWCDKLEIKFHNKKNFIAPAQAFAPTPLNKFMLFDDRKLQFRMAIIENYTTLCSFVLCVRVLIIKKQHGKIYPFCINSLAHIFFLSLFCSLVIFAVFAIVNCNLCVSHTAESYKSERLSLSLSPIFRSASTTPYLSSRCNNTTTHSHTHTN